MNRDIYSQAEQLNKKHRRKRTWYEILSVPICLVIFVTTYALILPAITMESTPDTYCGIVEHVHTDDCYELPGTPAHKEIQCTAGADLGQGEYIVHKHDSFCFDDSGELLCALAEQDEHVHTDACYDGDSLICGLVTGIVHQHTADCVISVPATEPQGLVCTVEEHKHTEACFMNPEGEASSGKTGDDVPADKPPASDVPTGGDPSNETPGGDVPTDAALGGNVPGDAVQSTGAANGDTPEGDAAVNSTPARAPAASGPITDVTITIHDNVSTSGCYEAAVTDGDAALEGKKVQYRWYKSTDGGATYTPVEAENFTAGGNTVSISGEHGEKLFLALDGGTVSDTLQGLADVLLVDLAPDGGTVSDTLPSVIYKAVLMVDGTEYDSVSACINTTPALALAASGPITDVTITINDNVSTSGCYEVAVTGGDAALEGKNVQYQWSKSTDDGATYTPVEAENFTAGGKTVSNISGEHGEKLFLALDGGTVSDTLPSVRYKAVLKVDGTIYDSVSAECTNTTHQASVLNGSFEAPDLTNYYFQQFVPEGTKGLFWKTTASNEEGGQPAYPSSRERENDTGENDGNHYIEIIDTGTDGHKGQAAFHHQQGTATNGKQYAEINAGAAGALYQTIATIPGTTMYWSVDHSGREGTDTMAVVMMPESTAESIATQPQLLEVLKNPSGYGATVVSNLSASQGV